MSEATKLIKEGTVRLQGKDYTLVAYRVLAMRQEHPDWSIHTRSEEIDEVGHMRAEICDGKGDLLATAHKKIRKGQRGPAGEFAVETAETGAIGRALALCGYGTLAGDLDEGEEIADAPVEKREYKSAPSPEVLWVKELDAVRTKEEFNELKEDLNLYLETLDKRTAEYKQAYQAGVRALKRIGG